jgi:hypothetical protein
MKGCLGIFLFGMVVGGQAWAQDAALGARLYRADAAVGAKAPANSCAFCHGDTGTGGSVAAAAKISQPKTWKSYKALGGDAAFAASKAAFLVKLEDAVENVMINGAIRHNVTYKKPGYDLAKAGGPLNAQMLGLSGAPSVVFLKKNNVTKEVAAKALWAHMKTLDTQGVLK